MRSSVLVTRRKGPLTEEELEERRKERTRTELFAMCNSKTHPWKQRSVFAQSAKCLEDRNQQKNFKMIYIHWYVWFSCKTIYHTHVYTKNTYIYISYTYMYIHMEYAVLFIYIYIYIILVHTWLCMACPSKLWLAVQAASPGEARGWEEAALRGAGDLVGASFNL